MSRFIFYNNRKPRKFGYTPILYDPDKEQRAENLQKRIQDIKREMNPESVAPVQEERNLKDEFLAQTKHLKKRKEREDAPFFTNNRILFFIFVILAAVLLYWILA